MAGIDETVNWLINHWYYFALLIMAFFMLNWYQELKKFRSQFFSFSTDRLKKKTKDEPKINPPSTWKWLAREKSPFSNKLKYIGRIRSFKSIKLNPSGEKITTIAETRIVPYARIPLGNKKCFIFEKKSVMMDIKKKTIIIPYQYYFNEHPTGEWILIDDTARSTYAYAQKDINIDLRKLAIDGYGAQMRSFSSVKPTWGHEDRVKEKELEAKTLGFGRFLKKKEEPPKDEE